MKRRFLYYLLGICVLISACQKDEITYRTEVETIEVTSLINNTATSGGMITSEGRPTIKERGIEWCLTKDFDKDVLKVASDKSELGEYSCVMTDLQQRTTYYVRAYAKNDFGVIYGNVLCFTTPAKPIVKTEDIIYVTGNTFTSGGEITDDGDSTILARGICWGTDSLLTIDGWHTSDSVGVGKFTSVVDSLTLGTKYYVRAYAQNAAGTGYGEIKSVTTHNYPKVITSEISDIQYTSAKGGGIIDDDGGTEILTCGVCWAKSPKEPTIENPHSDDKLDGEAFASAIIDLEEGITYNVRAYAINSIGLTYGDVVSFRSDFHAPTVITFDAVKITSNSATCSGKVTSDGGDAVIERGICYSTTEMPTTAYNKIISGGGMGRFDSKLADLLPGTTYYVRAYAVNGKGTSYGEQKTFTTEAVLANIKTLDVTNITMSTAICGGEIISDGGASVTERGVCYSTSKNPTIADNKVTSGSGTGTFSCELIQLSKGTIYYVRAYATNSKGTVYGEQKMFTSGATQATLTTSDVINITMTSATCGGNVTSDGGATVTERGVCYSTSQNPTISDTKVSSGSGTGSFSCNLTNLTDGTTYYVRAYATNNKGTSYGEQKTFTTTAIVKPTVTTSAVTNITTTSATCGGNVTADGGATVTERGVCYSTSENPTISNSKVTSGSGTGSFSSNLTNLTDGTTYYVRAYATNNKGTSYGEQKTFTTTAIVTPIVTTSDVTNITTTSATCGGNVTSDGNSVVTERGVCYSTSQNPTIANSKVTSGSGTGSFSCNLTNLADGTIYYVRAYATNGKGTAYGEQKTFTTTAIVKPTVTTSAVTNITTTSATCDGNVTSDGGATVTERGVCYSTSQNPTISNSKVSSGSGTGAFSSNLTNLADGTIYYVRAYATNGKGTAYGEQKTFTTTAIVTPTVTTSDVTNITTTSATCGGNVTSDGNSVITERGVCYSTSQNPTISNNKVSSGSGTGAFSSNLTNLADGTIYYVRAYATNGKGTSYGDQKTFTTTAIVKPTVTTSAVTNITATSATCGGNVTSDGGVTVTERGVCYSTSQNPTISNSKVSSGSGIGAYTCIISGLHTSTTYYFRAYAINSKGTDYGEEYTFSTYYIPTTENGKLSGTFSVSSTDKVYFSQGNLQYQASTNTWRFADYQWEYIGESNVNLSSTYSGWIDLFALGTSGYNGIYPYSGYFSENKDIAGTNYDWGKYNAISNGGNHTGQWRTLEDSEWDYIVHKRANANNLRTRSIVNNVSGIIFLPDNWSLPSGIILHTGSMYFSSNVFSVSEWQILENAGAVFLPAAGFILQDGIEDDRTYGYYWSSTKWKNTAGVNSSYYLVFADLVCSISRDKGSASRRYSVRLVK